MLLICVELTQLTKDAYINQHNWQMLFYWDSKKWSKGHNVYRQAASVGYGQFQGGGEFRWDGKAQNGTQWVIENIPDRMWLQGR